MISNSQLAGNIVNWKAEVGQLLRVRRIQIEMFII